jgi:hypothetical protein
LIKTEPNRTVNTPKSHHLFLIFHPNILLISNILIHPPHMHIKGFIYACCLPIIKKSLALSVISASHVTGN